MNSRKYIKIRQLDAGNHRIAAEIDYSRDLRRYFLTDYFFVEYDQDVSDVHKSLLYIPMVSSMITLAWAVGADIYVEELDKAYLDSLIAVEPAFQKQYPQFSFSTRIHVKKITFNEFRGERCGLLFSCGVDSLTSFLRHRNKRPDLFTIWGADVSTHDPNYWERVRGRIGLFANQVRLDVCFVKSNMRDLLNEDAAARRYGLEGLWFIGSGLTSLGLCAPLTIKRRIGTMLIASPGRFRGYRDTTDLMNEFSWADVRVVVDGYELSRQKKVNCLAQNSEYLPYLRVCYSSRSKYNCGRCEKCSRTILALLAEGVDPRGCNFNIDERTFKNIRHCLVKGRWDFGQSERSMWMDIQDRLSDGFEDSGIPGSKEFLSWFKELDIVKCKKNELQHFLWLISYYIGEEGVVETARRSLAFIMRNLRR